MICQGCGADHSKGERGVGCEDCNPPAVTAGLNEYQFSVTWTDGALVTVQAEDADAAYELVAELDPELLLVEEGAELIELPAGIVNISRNESLQDIEINTLEDGD